ncbi:MAG: hypothetical protein ACFCGT_05270, partial [Sandaracinaceae bacterium]
MTARSRLLAGGALLALGLLWGCGTSSEPDMGGGGSDLGGPGVDLGVDEGPQDVDEGLGEQCVEGSTVGDFCQFNADCNDNCFCNGTEVCNGGICALGTAQCDDGIPCTVDDCDEEAARCTNLADDSLCDDGNSCTGFESCDAFIGCLPG